MFMHIFFVYCRDNKSRKALEKVVKTLAEKHGKLYYCNKLNE